MTGRFTMTDLVYCANREVAQRRKVYPRLVERGTMSPISAERQTAMMLEIATFLEGMAGKERLL